jgi:sulfite oxidase
VSVPDKHPGLIVRRAEPLNAETPLELLRASRLTPTELFFVRNHGDVPAVEAASYRLRVDGLVERPLSLTLDDLRAGYATTELDAVLACAGNRRTELARVSDFPGELMWDAGAIGCARWAGVSLGDVLAAAGVQAGAAHVAFTGLDRARGAGEGNEFGASIPLDKALRGEVLLAHEMNGEQLLPLHGFPLRAVVPGYVGARSVKWLSSVTVQAQPSDNFFQVHDYVVEGEALQELTVSSTICRVGRGAAEGYALAGAHPVERVELSLDRGESWFPAELGEPGERWAWRLWRAELPPNATPDELAVRAWDSSGATQPEDPAAVWNPKGYMNNAWHRVAM